MFPEQLFPSPLGQLSPYFFEQFGILWHAVTIHYLTIIELIVLDSIQRLFLGLCVLKRCWPGSLLLMLFTLKKFLVVNGFECLMLEGHYISVSRRLP